MSGKTPHSSIKRAASKKKTAVKKVAKKTVKKTTKKTAKKVVKKTTKKVTKKTTKKAVADKVPKNTKEKVIRVVKIKNPLSPLVPKVHTAVLTLATYQSRVPFDPHAFMTTTARASGLAFVLVGGLFVALNSSHLPGQTSQSAALIESQPEFSVSEEFGEEIENEFESVIEKSRVELINVPQTLPTLEISLPELSEYQETVQVEAYIENANTVSWYVVSQHSATKHFVAMVNKADDGKWVGKLNTINLPNGTYKLFAEASTPFGIIVSSSTEITIKNENISSVEAMEITETVRSIAADIPSVENLLAEDMGQYNESINKLFNRLTVAYRNNDQQMIADITAQLQALQQEMVGEVADDTDESQYTIATYIEEARLEHESRLAEQMKVISERQYSDVFKDTDQDGISDYDEVALFATDPTVADSDNDGVIDGLEIKGGYDPLDANRDSAIVYESPKEYGIERSDILSIDSFVSIQDTADVVSQNTTGEGVSRLQAQASGQALPNSFVTLYIYSSPVVVTVKTDEFGNWEYLFDKELEDGEHTVYVGITDNTGHIVAKSAPFKFVKEAQAVTPIAQADIDALPPSSNDSPFASQSIMLMVSSLSIIAIGIVLVLLGVSLEIRQPIKVKAREEDVSNS